MADKKNNDTRRKSPVTGKAPAGSCTGKRPEKRAECKNQETDPGRCGTGIRYSGSQGNEP